MKARKDKTPKEDIELLNGDKDIEKVRCASCGKLVNLFTEIRYKVEYGNIILYYCNRKECLDSIEREEPPLDRDYELDNPFDYYF